MKELFVKDFANAIEFPEDEVNDNLDLQGVQTWDSLAFIVTISLVDRHFKIILDNEALQSVRYFKDLKLLINDKLAA